MPAEELELERLLRRDVPAPRGSRGRRGADLDGGELQRGRPRSRGRSGGEETSTPDCGASPRSPSSELDSSEEGEAPQPPVPSEGDVISPSSASAQWPACISTHVLRAPNDEGSSRPSAKARSARSISSIEEWDGVPCWAAAA